MALRGSIRPARGGRPQTLAEALNSFLKERGLLQEMKDRQVTENWDELVGPTIAREARPIKIERGILWIGVNNAPQANQLSYLIPKLIERIKELYPQSKIRDIRVLHRPRQGRGD
jgi:predicted nucleic acid-binding Zn ribbon protein